MYDTYLWDTNSDGYTDITTTEPTLIYAYRSSYTGPLHVTAMSSTSGLSASTDFNVTILSSYKAPTRPLAPLDLTVKKLPNDSVSVSWTHDPSDTVTARWLLRIDDFPVGRMALPATQITVTDMHFEEKKPVTITVAGLTGSELEGAQSSVTIQPALPDDAVINTNDTKTNYPKQSPNAPFDLNQPSATHPLLLTETNPDSNTLLSTKSDTSQLSVPGDEVRGIPATRSSPNLWLIAIAMAVTILGTLGYIKLRK